RDSPLPPGALLLFAAVVAFLVLVGSAAAEPPTVVMGTVTNPGYTSAKVTGEVDPKGEPTQWFFEVSSDGEKWQGAGAEGGIPEGNVPPPNGLQPVAGELQN